MSVGGGGSCWCGGCDGDDETEGQDVDGCVLGGEGGGKLRGTLGDRV